MGIMFLLLLASQLPPADTLNVRIVGHPDAPAGLVGRPFSDSDDQKMLLKDVSPNAAGETALFGPIQSPAFPLRVHLSSRGALEGASTTAVDSRRRLHAVRSRTVDQYRWPTDWVERAESL